MFSEVNTKYNEYYFEIVATEILLIMILCFLAICKAKTKKASTIYYKCFDVFKAVANLVLPACFLFNVFID